MGDWHSQAGPLPRAASEVAGVSQDRYASDPPFLQKHRSTWRGPHGRRACRMCGQEVPAGRTSWCSEACVRAWKEISTSSGLRRAVVERDRGRCNYCGTDCRRVERMCIRSLGRIDRWAAGLFVAVMESSGWRGLFRPRVWMTVDGPVKGWDVITAWHADHVVAVAAGGGATGRANAQTLCLRCHHERTSGQAKARAKLLRTERRRERYGRDSPPRL